MADFDRQLVESDAYLQLLIQQAHQLQQRQASCPAAAEQQRLAALVEHVNVSSALPSETALRCSRRFIYM